MPAGELDRRIVLQRAIPVADLHNELVKTWTDLAVRWAKVTPISDGERIRMAEVSAEITTRFMVRHSTSIADLNPKDRILYESRIYDIWGVKEIGRRKFLEISATARAD